MEVESYTSFQNSRSHPTGKKRFRHILPYLAFIFLSQVNTSPSEYSFLCPLLLAHHLEYFEFRLECKQFDCGLLSSVYLLHNLIPVCTAQYAETDLISSIIRFAEIRTVLVLMLHFAVSKPVEILSLCTGDRTQYLTPMYFMSNIFFFLFNKPTSLFLNHMTQILEFSSSSKTNKVNW